MIGSNHASAQMISSAKLRSIRARHFLEGSARLRTPRQPLPVEHGEGFAAPPASLEPASAPSSATLSQCPWSWTLDRRRNPSPSISQARSLETNRGGGGRGKGALGASIQTSEHPDNPPAALTHSAAIASGRLPRFPRGRDLLDWNADVEPSARVHLSHGLHDGLLEPIQPPPVPRLLGDAVDQGMFRSPLHPTAAQDGVAPLASTLTVWMIDYPRKNLLSGAEHAAKLGEDPIFPFFGIALVHLVREPVLALGGCAGWSPGGPSEPPTRPRESTRRPIGIERVVGPATPTYRGRLESEGLTCARSNPASFCRPMPDRYASTSASRGFPAHVLGRQRHGAVRAGGLLRA